MLFCCGGRDLELHGFSDSSEKAYGACVLVRVSCEHEGSGRLWTNKCRLAPVKELSTPQLELLACLLLSSLMVSVKLAVEKEVSVKKIFCWTDLQTTLWYFRQRHKQWKIRVHNRIETIRENVVVENWGFVVTSVNPAEICSRECSVGKLKSFFCGGKDQKFCWMGKRCGHHKSFYCQRGDWL